MVPPQPEFPQIIATINRLTNLPSWSWWESNFTILFNEYSYQKHMRVCIILLSDSQYYVLSSLDCVQPVTTVAEVYTSQARREPAWGIFAVVFGFEYFKISRATYLLNYCVTRKEYSGQ